MEGDILMKIQESAENYLETILMLGKAKGNVRSIDIATAPFFFQAKRQRRHEESSRERIYFDG